MAVDQAAGQDGKAKAALTKVVRAVTQPGGKDIDWQRVRAVGRRGRDVLRLNSAGRRQRLRANEGDLCGEPHGEMRGGSHRAERNE